MEKDECSIIPVEPSAVNANHNPGVGEEHVGLLEALNIFIPGYR
jgi:hypothetical protein